MASNISSEKHEVHDDAVEDVPSRARLAAQSIEYEKSLTFWQAFTIYWRSSLWVLYGMLIAFNYGMDGIIAGYQVSVPKFREDYGTPFPTGTGVIYIIPGRWLSIFSGVSQACGILGSVLAGWLADKIGRRYTNTLSCVISVIGVCVQYWSNKSLTILCAGKAINGISCGMWLVLGPLYASEVACLRLRGVLSAMTNTILLAGVYLFTGVMYHLGALPYRSSYMIPFACQWIVPGIVLLTFWFWPESPVWLVRVGKRDAAIKSLEMLHGQHSKIDKQGLLAQIEETLELERASRSGSTKDSNNYMEAFSKPHRRRTIIVMFVYGCQYLSGNTFIIGYQVYFYQLIGYATQTSLLLGLLHTSLLFVTNIIAWCVIAKIRRRPLIVWGQFFCAVCLFIIGGLCAIGNPVAYKGAVGLIFVWGFIYEISLATVGWTVGSEIPALRMRSRTQGLANVVLSFASWLMAFIFPYMFNPDTGNLVGQVGFVFGGTTLVGFVGTFFLLPEGKDRTAAEMDILFEKKIPIRQFHTTKVTVTEETFLDRPGEQDL